jgi:hypothetical protein
MFNYNFIIFAFMLTGTVISDVESTLSAISVDDVLPRQYLYNVLLDETYKLIRQKKNLQNLFKDSKLVTFLDCVPMVSVKGEDCCGLKGEIMRTKDKIPSFNISSGDGILGVYTVDDNETISRFDGFRQLNENRNRRFGKLEKGFVYNDDYIYVSGSKPKAINVVIIKDPAKVLEDLEKNASDCQGIEDIEFPCPNDLLPYAKAAAVQFIMNTVKRIPEDENPNLDSGIKSKDNPVNL